VNLLRVDHTAIAVRDLDEFQHRRCRIVVREGDAELLVDILETGEAAVLAGGEAPGVGNGGKGLLPPVGWKLAQGRSKSILLMAGSDCANE